MYQIVAGQRIIRDRQKDTHKFYNRLRKMTRSIYIFRAGSTEEMTETKVNVYLIQANYEITLRPLE